MVFKFSIHKIDIKILENILNWIKTRTINACLEYQIMMIKKTKSQVKTNERKENLNLKQKPKTWLIRHNLAFKLPIGLAMKNNPLMVWQKKKVNSGIKFPIIPIILIMFWYYAE